MLTGNAEYFFVKWLHETGQAEQRRGTLLQGTGPIMLNFPQTSGIRFVYWENLPELFKQALIVEWLFSVGYALKASLYVGDGKPTLTGYYRQAIKEGNDQYNQREVKDVRDIDVTFEIIENENSK